jgi:hypothetical protein
MGGRPRKKALRKGPQFFGGLQPRQDAAAGLVALARAWTVTTIVAALLLAALAVAPMWDGAIFLQALRDALGRDPQLMQPIEETPAEAQGKPKSSFRHVE